MCCYQCAVPDDPQEQTFRVAVQLQCPPVSQPSTTPAVSITAGSLQAQLHLTQTPLLGLFYIINLIGRHFQVHK